MLANLSDELDVPLKLIADTFNLSAIRVKQDPDVTPVSKARLLFATIRTIAFQHALIPAYEVAEARIIDKFPSKTLRLTDNTDHDLTPSLLLKYATIMRPYAINLIAMKAMSWWMFNHSIG